MARLREVEASAPLAFPCAGVLTGLVLDHDRPLPSAFCAATLGAIAALLAARVVRRRMLMPLVFCAGLCTGALLDLTIWHRRLPSDISGRVSEPFSLVRVRGVVAETPRLDEPEDYAFARWARSTGRCAFLLDVDSALDAEGWRPTEGRLRVSLQELPLELRVGDHVEAFGRLIGFRPRSNPGGFDAANYFRLEGISAALACDTALNIRRISPEQAHRSLSATLAWVRDAWRRVMMEDWPADSEADRGLIEALVLGQRSALSRAIDRLFADLGLTHIIAVSGSHLAAIVGGAWGLARLLAMRRKHAAILMFVSTLLYASVAEPRAPTVRAIIGTGLYCLGAVQDLRARPLNIIAAAALCIALLDPMEVFTAGFQLSFAASIGIVVLVPACERMGIAVREGAQNLRYGYLAAELRRRVAALHPRSHGAPPSPMADGAARAGALDGHGAWQLRKLMRKFVALPVLVSICAWVATAPLVAWHFNQVQWMGPINTLVIGVPAALLINLGFLAMLLSVVAPQAALPIKGCMTLVEELLLTFARALPSGPPLMQPTPSPPVWLVLLWYAALAAFAWVFRPDHSVDRLTRAFPPLTPSSAAPMRIGRAAAWLLAGSCAIVMVASLVWHLGLRRRDRLRVTTLSVGNGLSVVIECPDGGALLYDCGSDAPFDAGRRILAPFLRSRGISTIDAVFISHPNLDHFSGLPGLISSLSVGDIHVTPYFCPMAPPGSPARALIDRLCEGGLSLHTVDERITSDAPRGMRVQRLWPPDDLPEGEPANNASMVLRLSCHGHSMLLTGDIEHSAQEALMHTYGPELRSDVLLMPHHASVRTNAPEFIEAVDPAIVISSAGRMFPRARATLTEWFGARAWFNTGEAGAVTVEMTDEGIQVWTGGDPRPVWRAP